MFYVRIKVSETRLGIKRKVYEGKSNGEDEIKVSGKMAELYPTMAEASTEIINLQSILNLPKGTEHFITDIHGEYEAFSHVLKMVQVPFEEKLILFLGIP